MWYFISSCTKRWMFMYVLLPPTSTHGRLDSHYVNPPSEISCQLLISELAMLIALWIRQNNSSNSTTPPSRNSEPTNHEIMKHETMSWVLHRWTRMGCFPKQNLKKKDVPRPHLVINGYLLIAIVQRFDCHDSARRAERRIFPLQGQVPNQLSRGQRVDGHEWPTHRWY